MLDRRNRNRAVFIVFSVALLLFLIFDNKILKKYTLKTGDKSNIFQPKKERHESLKISHTNKKKLVVSFNAFSWFFFLSLSLSLYLLVSYSHVFKFSLFSLVQFFFSNFQIYFLTLSIHWLHD
jgi:hypothetical protein